MAKEKNEEMKLPSIDEIFSSQEERDEAKLKKIYDIPVDQIDPFPDHPFKVKDDEDMQHLMESIKAQGIITPCTVRKKKDGRYEIISGHRRKRACELLGIPTLRCEVVDLSKDEATILMVESNFQRSRVLPSEKAFAYKMRLEAMKMLVSRMKENQRMGRNYGGNPVEPQLKQASENLAQAYGISEEDISKIGTAESRKHEHGAPVVHPIGKSRMKLAEMSPESHEQIRRYDKPAQKKTVRAGETAVFNFTNVKAKSLKLRKIDHNTKEALSGAEFELYEGSALAARFTLDINGMGAYIINMLYTNGEIQPEYLPSESDEEEPDEIIEDDDDIFEEDDDDEPTSGGGDSGGSEGTGEEGSDEEEDLEKDWGVLKGLKEGVQYRLKETKAPEGYDCDFEQTFTFQDQLEIEAENVISNHDFIVQKNVTGDLGDLTKEFEYDAVFTNLKPNKTYEYSYMKELIMGGDDNEETVGSALTYTSDVSGNASIHFKMKDGQIVHFVKLPTEATYQITEAASDHVAQYDVASIDEPDNCTIVKKHDTNHTAGSAKPLATARETIDPDDGTIVITFQNNRDLAPILGTGSYMPMWIAGLGVISLLAAIMGWAAYRRRKLRLLLEEE